MAKFFRIEHFFDTADSRNNSIIVYDFETGSEKLVLHDQKDSYFSEDSAFLILVEDETLCIWNIETNQRVFYLQQINGDISANLNYYYLLSKDYSLIHIYEFKDDFRQSNIVQSIPNPYPVLDGDVKFSDSGNFIAWDDGMYFLICSATEPTVWQKPRFSSPYEFLATNQNLWAMISNQKALQRNLERADNKDDVVATNQTDNQRSE